MNETDLDNAEGFEAGPTTPSGPVVTQVLAPDEALMPDEAL